MGLFKDVKKPVIRQTPRATADVSPLRPVFMAKQPPCSARCGAGADVRAWITAIAEAQDGCEAAWRILADAHPFPATLGRICPHTCEQGCHRQGKDGGVAINALERWLGDVALARGFALPVLPPSAGLGRVAVVGAGPAGLSCAYQLARRGHTVTILEARDVPGGRLRDATRTGRLAAAIVDAEIARIVALGVELRCATRVPADLAGLEAYDFVFVATGRAPSDGGGQAVSGLRTTEYGAAKGVLVGGDAVHPGLVSAAIASGRAASDAIDAAVNERQAVVAAPLPAIAADRVTLSWYADAPRLDVSAEASAEADARMIAEAKRCMSCGFCMDCERCWMYCTNNCFEKLPQSASTGPKAVAYRLNVETCNGCRKCADECPCGYIDMV